jgi:hypothetical protein
MTVFYFVHTRFSVRAFVFEIRAVFVYVALQRSAGPVVLGPFYCFCRSPFSFHFEFIFSVAERC